MIFTGKKQDFLSNKQNKQNFIMLLAEQDSMDALQSMLQQMQTYWLCRLPSPLLRKQVPQLSLLQMTQAFLFCFVSIPVQQYKTCSFDLNLDME